MHCLQCRLKIRWRLTSILLLLYYIRIKQFNHFDDSLKYYNVYCCRLQNKGYDNKEASSILWSPFDILNDRIVDSDVKPTYRIIGTDVVSYKTIYNYSCTLYGLYGRYKTRDVYLIDFWIMTALFFFQFKSTRSKKKFEFIVLQTIRFMSVLFVLFITSIFLIIYFLIHFS